jgi:hypothetical protein
MRRLKRTDVKEFHRNGRLRNLANRSRRENFVTKIFARMSEPQTHHNFVKRVKQN